MNEQSAPVRVGETFDVAINSIGGKGDGIAKVKGFVLFVANTQKGDYVKVRVTKVLPTVGFAEVVEKLEKQHIVLAVREILEKKIVRASPHFFNTESEILRVIDAIKNL